MMSRVKKPLKLPVPETVTIGGHTYTVKVDALSTVAMGRDGCCDPLTETIAINPQQVRAAKTSQAAPRLRTVLNRARRFFTVRGMGI